jgi:HSP20 family molecular chaperone IbpA
MSTTIEHAKPEAPAAENVERTQSARLFIPRTDICETPDTLVVTAEMPGVCDSDVDITLEKHVLTITGRIQQPICPDGIDGSMTLSGAEYEVGDYQRSFTLSDEIDRDHIEATMKGGILKLVLPKSTIARSRKISVKAGI